MDPREASQALLAEAPPRSSVWVALGLVLVYAGWKAWPFLGEGLPIFFDAHSHLARTWMAQRALAAGQYPSWSNDWYGGFRLLEFSSPAYYLLTGGVSLLVRDVVSATKLVLWLGQLVSAGGFFLFGLRLLRAPWLAAFATLLFVHSTGRQVVLGTMGNYPTLLLYALAPFLLAHWAAPTRDGERRLVERCALPGLLVAGLLLAHLSNSVAILPALAAFGLAAHGRRGLAEIGSGLALGASLAAFSIVPLLLHLDRVSLSFAVVSPQLHLASLGRALGLVAYSPDHAFAPGQGSALWGVGMAVGLATLRPDLRAHRPLAVGLAASLASLVVLGDRAAIALPFFLLPLCAVAMQIATRFAILHGLPRGETLAPALACAAVILAPWPSLGPIPRYEPASSLDLYGALPETRLPSRTFDVTTSTISLDGFYGWSSVSPLVSGRSIPFGGFPQGAPLSNNVSLALGGQLARELRGEPPRLSDDGADFLYLHNVELLVDRHSDELVRRVQLKVELPPVLRDLAFEPALGRIHAPGLFHLRHASPAIFAPRLEPLPAPFDAGRRDGRPPLFAHLLEVWRRDPLNHHPDASLDVLFRTLEKDDAAPFLPLLRSLELDRARATARRFYVDGLERAEGTDATPDAFEVMGHEETATRVRLEVRAPGDGFVRLSYSHDPDLDVRVDDAPALARADALGGGLVLAIAAGPHTITLERPRDGLRTALLVLSALGAAALVAVAFRAGRRRV